MDRVTAGWLRDQVGKHGFSVSGDNFQEFVAWGIVPEQGDDGLYPLSALQTMIRARQLGAEIGSKMLYRRVVQLRCEGCPIPDAKLVLALVRTATTMRRPARTMAAVRQMRVRLADPSAEKPSRRAAARERAIVWKPPTPDRWKDILYHASSEYIGAQIGFWCYSAGTIRELARIAHDDLANVPIYDVVSLIAVNDTSATLANVVAGRLEPPKTGPIFGRSETPKNPL